MSKKDLVHRGYSILLKVLRELDSNQQPTGYGPVELPLLHPAMILKATIL